MSLEETSMRNTVRHNEVGASSYLRDKSALWPTTLFVTEDASQDAMVDRVRSRLPNAKVVVLDASGDPITEQGYFSETPADANNFDVGKRALMLTRYKGSWLRACPGTSGHVCCNLWVVNPGEGCPMDCTYCYLQSYLKRNPTLKLYTNLDEMCQSIAERAALEPKRLFRVGTGELIDSLVWDDLTDSTLELVPFFAKLDNCVLELKTKDSGVSNLLSLRDQHEGKTVVSWSVNARAVTERDEADTASLDQRIAAAAAVADAGYRVGLHFDPLVLFEGWQDGYREAIADIFARIKPEQVAWISVSSFRYRSEMQGIMLERFPESALPFGEQFLAKDNKLRYVQPLRFKLLQFVWSELKAVSTEMPIYMCMESAAAWRTVHGGPPAAGTELREVFARNKRLPILSSAASS